jgi:hypothetical protein
MSTALDVAIGLVFLYLLLALTVTTVQELIASFFALRARHLYGAIAGMLREGGADPAGQLLKRVYEHPLVRNLVDKELRVVAGKLPWRPTGLPSYIPSKTFAIVLLDVLRGETVVSATGVDTLLAKANEVVAALPASPLKGALTLLVADVHTVEQSVERRAAMVSQRVEGLFNDRMARASGWYKRKAQAWSLAIAFALAVGFNADSVRMAHDLWSDASLRAVVVANADAFRDASAPPARGGEPGVVASVTNGQAMLGTLQQSSLPLGWSHAERTLPGVLRMLLGWVVTALAVSLGAGFWFDLLGKALNLRGSGARVSAATGRVEG